MLWRTCYRDLTLDSTCASVSDTHGHMSTGQSQTMGSIVMLPCDALPPASRSSPSFFKSRRPLHKQRPFTLNQTKLVMRYLTNDIPLAVHLCPVPRISAPWGVQEEAREPSQSSSFEFDLDLLDRFGSWLTRRPDGSGHKLAASYDHTHVQAKTNIVAWPNTRG